MRKTKIKARTGQISRQKGKRVNNLQLGRAFRKHTYYHTTALHLDGILLYSMRMEMEFYATLD